MTAEDRPHWAPIVVGIPAAATAGHYLGPLAMVAVLAAALTLILLLPGGTR
jgi:hypothetical protein